MNFFSTEYSTDFNLQLSTLLRNFSDTIKNSEVVSNFSAQNSAHFFSLSTWKLLILSRIQKLFRTFSAQNSAHFLQLNFRLKNFSDIIKRSEIVSTSNFWIQHKIQHRFQLAINFTFDLETFLILSKIQKLFRTSNFWQTSTSEIQRKMQHRFQHRFQLAINYTFDLETFLILSRIQKLFRTFNFWQFLQHVRISAQISAHFSFDWLGRISDIIKYRRSGIKKSLTQIPIFTNLTFLWSLLLAINEKNNRNKHRGQQGSAKFSRDENSKWPLARYTMIYFCHYFSWITITK